jgi:hypothetical protein
MTLPRTAADVLSGHVVFEIESIDRMYLNVWQPRLQHGAGAAAFFTSHRGHAYASTALMDPMTKAFVADIHHFIASAGVDLVHFGKERKDEVTQRYLAGFTGTEGVLYVGRGQEKATVWRTQRRYHADGSSYAWLVKTNALVNYFYVYCVDADSGPFFLKFCTYFPYTAKLCIFSELRNCGPNGSNVVAAQGAVRDAKGQAGVTMTSSNEEEAGEPFSTGCPLPVVPGLRSCHLQPADRGIPVSVVIAAIATQLL